MTRNKGFLRKTLLPLAAGCLLASGPAIAQEEAGDGQPWRDYHAAMQGKTVGFVPMALGFDMAQAYDGAMRSQAEALGYTYIVRDPNWSVEGAVQVAEQFVAEGVDIMVIHPLDDKAFNRVLRKAKDAGIQVIFLNLRSGAGTDTMGGDVFIGADHYSAGKAKVELAAKFCEGKSNKVALIQAPLTNAVGIAETAGFMEQLKLHPELQLVAQQSADADANKAKSIAATILKQNPDLCAIVDQWDGQGIGIPAAIEEAGLKDQVALITSGSGSQANACDKVADGSYAAYVSSNIGTQTEILGATIAQMLQTDPPAGDKPYQIYVNSPIFTKESLASTPCWNLDYVTRPLN
jgi:ribose transport system substrate-binding protein